MRAYMRVPILVLVQVPSLLFSIEPNFWEVLLFSLRAIIQPSGSTFGLYSSLGAQLSG